MNWSPAFFKRSVLRILLLTISVNIWTPHSVRSQEQDTSPSTDPTRAAHLARMAIAKASIPGMQILETLHPFLRAALHPRTPGTEVLSSNQITDQIILSDRAFRAWRSQVEQTLNRPISVFFAGPTRKADRSLYESGRKALIQRYFDVAAALLRLRFGNGVSTPAEYWQDHYALSIPEDILASTGFIGFDKNDSGSAQETRLSEHFATYVRVGNQFRLGETYVQGLKLGADLKSPNKNSVLRIFKFLTLRELVGGLGDLYATGLIDELKFPEVSADLAEELGPLANLEIVYREQRDILDETLARDVLMQELDKVRTRLPLFLDSETQEGQEFFETAPRVAEFLESEQASESLPKYFMSETGQNLAVRASHLKDLNESEGIGALRALLSDSMVNTFKALLVAAVTEKRRDGITSEELAAMNHFLAEREASYSQALPEAMLRTLLKAVTERDQQARRSANLTFIYELSRAQAEIAQFEESYPRLSVLYLMQKAMIDRRFSSAYVKTWVDAIVAAPDFLAGRKKYAETVVTYTDASVLNRPIEEGGIPDTAKVEAFLASPEKLAFHPLWEDKVTDTESATRVLADWESRKADLKNLMAIARRFGFYQVDPKAGAPKILVRDVLHLHGKKDRRHFKAYQDVLKFELLGAPILHVPIVVREKKTTLFDAMTSPDHQNPWDHYFLGRELPALLDQAKKGVIDSVFTQFETVAKAKTLRDLDTELSTDRMKVLLRDKVTELKPSFDEYLKEKTTPTGTDLFFEYSGQMLHHAFTVMIAYEGVRLVSWGGSNLPWLLERVGLSGRPLAWISGKAAAQNAAVKWSYECLTPVINAIVWGPLPVFAGELAYQFHKYSELDRHVYELQKLYFAGGTKPRMVTIFSYNGAKDALSSKKSGLIMQVIFDTMIFMDVAVRSLPQLRGMLREHRLDRSAMETLGITSYSGLERGIKRLTRLEEDLVHTGRIRVTGEQLQKYRDAVARLENRIAEDMKTLKKENPNLTDPEIRALAVDRMNQLFESMKVSAPTLDDVIADNAKNAHEKRFFLLLVPKVGG